MSAWRGKNGRYHTEGMPHVTKIIRKPEGVGCEIKAAACAQTGCLVMLEIQEGKDRMKLKRFQLRADQALHDAAYQQQRDAGQVFKYSTAVTLRLAQPWFGNRREVVVDSAFASVESLIECHKKGMYMKGIVKTASVQYPKAVLREWGKSGGPGGNPPARGSHKVLKSTYTINGEEHTMMAVGWMDKTLKTVISNRGTTLPGTASMRHRDHLEVDPETGVLATVHSVFEVARPHVVESLFSSFNTIDVHDAARQGYLAMERNWRTHDYQDRIIATVEGLIYCDCYRAALFDHQRAGHAPEAGAFMGLFEYLDKLCHRMIFNPMLIAPVRAAAQPPKVCGIDH